MGFDEFQQMARLYVVGALEPDELRAFDNARREFGEAAEEFIREARQLNAAFALSLRPQPTRKDAKDKLMNLIRKTGSPGGGRLTT